MSADRLAVSDGVPVLSHTCGPVGIRVPPSRSQPVFRRAPPRRTPDILRAYPPATSTNCPVASDTGEGWTGHSPACHPGAGRPLRFPGCPPAVLRRFSRTTAGYVDHPQASGPAGDRPPPSLRRPCQQSNSHHAGKRYVLGRVLIETRELWLSTRECDFTGINIPILCWHYFQ